MALFRNNQWPLASAIFVAALLVYRVEYHSSSRLHDVGIEALQIGNSVALKGTFSDPFQTMPTGSSAHVAPGYPALVAIVIHFFGNGPMGNLVLGRLTVLVVALQLSLFPPLARHLGMGSFAGVLAAVAWLLAPIPMYRWESNFVALLAVLLAGPMSSACRRELSRMELTVTGTMWGLLLLFSPVPVIVLIFWILVLHFRARRSRSQILTLTILPALIILPWIIRNYLVFSELVFLRDNFGLELAISNNPCAQYSLDLNRGETSCFARNHPNENPEEAERVRQLGEVAYNHQRMREALLWIREHPARFFELTSERVVAFWLPIWGKDAKHPTPNARARTIVSLLTVLSIWGIYRLWRSNRNSVLLLCNWLVLYPLAYYVVQNDDRYRHPILWATFLLGCFPVAAFLSWILGFAKISQGRADGDPGNIPGKQIRDS